MRGEVAEAAYAEERVAHDQQRPALADDPALGRAAVKIASDCATQRIAFGRPIGPNQAVGFMLADMQAAVDVSRLLVPAGWLRGPVKPGSQPGGGTASLNAKYLMCSLT